MPSRPASDERALQDRLAQASGALEIGSDGDFQFFDYAQATLDFGDDPDLFGERWQLDCSYFQLFEAQVRPSLTVDVPLPLLLAVLL